jgi:hypothetical protein
MMEIDRLKKIKFYEDQERIMKEKKKEDHFQIVEQMR